MGWEHSLTIHAELVDRLLPVLRVFAGFAAQLIGDISAANVIKFHIQSAKLTLLMVDDFWGHHIPELLSRIKVNLRTQDIDIFEYGPGTRMKIDSTPVAGLDVRDRQSRVCA